MKTSRNVMNVRMAHERARAPTGAHALLRARSLLSRLRRDSRAAIGVPGVLVAAMLVGATALPVANVTLKAEKRRMEDAAAAAGLAATQKMRAEGVGVDQAVLRREADRYARLNLLDLPPDARRKALEKLQVNMNSDPAKQIVQVDLETSLPGTKVVRALMVAPGSGGGEVLPETSKGTSKVQCVSDKVELVLAIDVTESMDGQLAQSGVAPGNQPRRLDMAADVVGEMVDNIERLCSDLELKIGIVPWASSVKIPDGQESRWKRNSWIDKDVFTRRGAREEDWAGCLEDRLMNTAARREDSFGLSLDTAEDRRFPPYVYPDTERHTRRGDWVRTMTSWLEQRQAQGRPVPAAMDKDALVQVLQGDNDWSRGGGPNRNCPQIGMIPPRPLKAEDTWLDDALADMRAAELTGGGTLAHLGMTWGRRMLHPAWDAIWDPNGNSDDAKGGTDLKKDESVTQVLVLLSDGRNGFEPNDEWELVPGRASVHLGVDLEADWTEVTRLSMQRNFTSGQTLASRNLETATVVGYSALGRNGPGALADGHRGDTDHITSTEGGHSAFAIPDLMRKGEDFLDQLLNASCSEARSEGIEVYTVSLSEDAASASRQNAVLQACAGTDTHPGAADYAFQADDVDEIRAAFRDIGQRVARIRRAG